MKGLQYVFFFLCSHYKTLGICEGTPPCWNSSIRHYIFGSVRLFPIYGLVNFSKRGYMYRYRETGKGVTDWLTRHSSCILKCDIKRTMKYACLGSKVHRIKNIKFTVTTMSVRRYKTGCGNGLLACLDYESDKIAYLGLQIFEHDYPPYGFTKLQVWIFEHDYPPYYSG